MYIHTILSYVAPLCPTPPLPPADGSVLNNPLVFDTPTQRVCAVNNKPINLNCHSIFNIYIKTATIGRDPAQGKVLCNATDGK